MSIWTPCPTCGQPLYGIDHDDGCPSHDHVPGLGDILDEQRGYDELDFRDRARQGLASAVVEVRQFLTIPEVIQIVLDVFKSES